MEFEGEWRGRSVSRSERENLPPSVDEQVDYEDVLVTYVLATELRAETGAEIVRGLTAPPEGSS